MKAIILAAGRGSRLREHTDERPKCLTELGGRALIEWQLAALRAAGVEEITIVTGYRHQMLEFPGVGKAINPRWAETNMVESLFCAEAEFGDDLIVSYSDILYEPRHLRALLAVDHEIAVTVDRAWREYWEFRFEDPLSDAESLRLDDQGCIIDIGDKVDDIDKIEAQYMGLMRFRGAGLDALRAARRSMIENDRPWKAKRDVDNAYMTDLLMEMILRGERLHAVEISGGWLEIDTSDEYQRLAELFADGTIGRFFDPSTVPA